MSAVTNVSNLASQGYPISTANRPASKAGSANNGAVPSDQIDIVDVADPAQREVSLTGRIALNAEAGNLNSDQATQLYQQVASIQAQIVSDKQADGGTLSQQDAQTINQLQSQLSSSIYSDAHNGAAPPSTPPSMNAAQKREVLQAGRIELNEQAGNLSSSQAQQLAAQQAQIDQQIATDEQANGGSLTQSQAQAINQLQNQASQQIYETAHPSVS